MIVQYNFLKTWLLAHTTNERGASLVEYALLVALIAVVCIGAVSFLAGSAKETFSTAGNSITKANAG
ncbi:MAG TPA: Flp family type IVb pilin [Microthrixaceae bacterium]|nr:Flp family type IVb pilin [Microthrixaceae bacterium]